MPAKRFPLPKRFNVAMSEDAYRQLRALNAKYGYGNNYLLTILLENFEQIAKAGSIQLKNAMPRLPWCFTCTRSSAAR